MIFIRCAQEKRARISWTALCATGLVSVFVSSCSVVSFLHERDDFIHVQGTHFIYHEKPYYFTGANLWHGCYLGSPGAAGNRPRLLRELDSLRAYHITNLRLLAASEESYLRRSIKPAIQKAPGVVDDSLLIGLDFILAEMAKRRMHAVLYLNNYWEWSGGMAQYVVWATGADRADPEDRTKGYGGFMDFSATFYSIPAAVQMYYDYIERIVTRRNTVNGRLYSDDPTIMAWQLANEPRPRRDRDSGKRNLHMFSQWVDQTAAYIHSLDSHHLISTGSEGTVGCGLSAECFVESHSTPQLDYLTFHLWPLNWGWFNPKRISETLPPSETNALNYIDQHIGLARLLNRPIVMEEFGIGRDSAEFLPATPTTARDHYYRVVLQALYDSARAGSPIAGSNFWTWGGEGRAQHEDGVWSEGDSFVGDPPQEPQGRNSIFVSDTSTLRIIGTHARDMEQLENAGSFSANPK